MSYFRPTIEAMEGYEPGEQPIDPTVVKLNTNENPYPPSPEVIKAVVGIGVDELRRYPSPQADRFRLTAGELFGVRPEQIICGNGMDDILNITVRAFAGPDAPMAYPVPTYTLYAVLARLQDAPTHEIPFGPDYALPIDELIATRARVTYLANPNAPSGTLVPVEDVARLADGLEGVLCVDEAYVDFAECDCLELARSRPNVLVMRSLSKGYGLAGLRFGFAIGPEKLIAGLMKVKDSYNVDAVAAAAASAALADRDYYERMREKVIVERRRLAEALETLGLRCLPSQTNFLLVDCGTPAARELYETLKRRRILVRYFDSPGLDDKLRITIGTPRQNGTLIAALRELVR
jgi:histidinol-phosphate aminotransferase